MKPDRVLPKAGRRRRHLPGLLLLNVVLLALLAGVTFGPSADAQPRRRGDYVMVGGNVNGATAGIVYIVDADNQELIAVSYDRGAKDIAGVGYRNLAVDAINVVGRRRGN